MREKHAGFAQVNDIFGFRIVVPHAARVLPGAGRAAPALQAGAGALQGLHRHPQGQRLPVAAHHAGQPAGHGGGVPDPHRGHARGGRERHRRALAVQGQRQGRHIAGDAQRLGAMWLQSLLDIQDETRDAAEFLEHVKIDLFPDAVYVFTPQEQDPGAAARRHAGGLRLRHPLRRRRPLRGRQGQRRAGGAAHRAAQRRRGRDRHRARRAAQPGLAELRAHRPGALARSATT